MRRSLAFLWAFLRNPARNGSVVPSSRFLAAKMLEGIDFTRVRSVVELGPGEGVFTREILRRAAPGTKVVAIELNPDFARALGRSLGARAAVENVSAEDLEAVCARHGLGAPDLIVCGLAFASMPAAPGRAILAAVDRCRRAGSVFRMFTYVPGRVRRLFPERRFQSLGKVWRNVPPATVLTLE